MTQFPVSPAPPPSTYGLGPIFPVWAGSSVWWSVQAFKAVPDAPQAVLHSMSGCPGQPRLHCHLPVPLVSDFSYGVEDKVCMSKAQSCGAPGSDPFGGTLFLIWPVYFVLSICWALQGDCTNSLWSHKNNMIQIWKSNTDCLTSLFNHH